MFTGLTRWFARSAARPRASVRPGLEVLEARVALSIAAVPDTTAPPFSAVVEVEAINQGQFFSGSGVLLDGTHVLTAAHVLYDSGALDSSVFVYPGRNGDNVVPFGGARAVSLAVYPAYLQGPYAGTDAFDLGVITLDHNVGAGAGTFGLLPLYPDTYFNAGGTLDVLGYPGDTFSGVNQYFSTGPAESADALDMTWLLTAAPIQHGSSGSPVYVHNGNTRTVVGVISEISSTTAYATRLTPQKDAWITSQLSSSAAASRVPLAPAGPQGPGVFDPFTATWYLRNSDSPGAPSIAQFQFGLPGWTPVVGDWDGDGLTSIGVVDPLGDWYLKNSNQPGTADIGPFAFGGVGLTPVAGDWNGDGITTPGAFDPQTGVWYLRNSNTTGGVDVAPFQFGGPGWLPVVGDWSGTGHTGIGVFDPTTATFYLRSEAGPGYADAGIIHYGGAGWRPVVGDWDGDGKTSIGVVDPLGNWYLRNLNSQGAPDIRPFAYGAPWWTPLAGSWASPVVPQGGGTATQSVRAVPGLAGAGQNAPLADGALLAFPPAWARLPEMTLNLPPGSGPAPEDWWTSRGWGIEEAPAGADPQALLGELSAPESRG